MHYYYHHHHLHEELMQSVTVCDQAVQASWLLISTLSKSDLPIAVKMYVQ